MRYLPLAIAAALLFAVPTAAAQSDDHSAAAYTYRGAIGDIPGTPAREAANAWNVQETILFNATTTAARAVTLPDGHTFGDLVCTCNGSFEADGSRYLWTVGANQTGEHTLTFTHVRPATTASLLVTIDVPAGDRDDARIILFVAPDEAIDLDVAHDRMPAAGRTGDLLVITGDSDAPVAAVHAAVAPAPVLPTPEQGISPLLMMVLGIIIGVVAWAALVQGGMVQKRTRKQVAAVAAHKEVAKVESAATLDGRKRVLMAGLKELEMAKATKGIEDDVYDALKAEYKKQTVTVMRALEEARQA